MGGAVAALGSAAGAIGSGVKAVGSDVASGARALYGDEKNMVQTGQPNAQGTDPTMTQQLLFGQQQRPTGPTPAQQLRRTTASY